MALNLAKFKSNLKTALLNAQKKNQKDGVDTDTALGNLADEIATQVDAYIKTATVSVTVSSGIEVQVTPSSGQGSTTGTGSGSGTLS